MTLEEKVAWAAANDPSARSDTPAVMDDGDDDLPTWTEGGLTVAWVVGIASRACKGDPLAEEEFETDMFSSTATSAWSFDPASAGAVPLLDDNRVATQSDPHIPPPRA
jgi:hypothetical protein